MLLEPPGQIITFYSYKGGTGRTMALANVACVLAKKQVELGGKGVLMIDWDLEAPGLYRFFQRSFTRLAPQEPDPDAWLDRQEGLLDLFWDLEQATRDYGTEQQRQGWRDARELLDEIRPERRILATDIPQLSLLKAGRLDPKYAERVNTFRWEQFYHRAPWLIQAFAERLSKLYRYVLIDSRTGLTDVSGICTMLLPERLVMVFTPNRQSIEGGLLLIERATNYRRQSSDLRPLVVFPLASRVDPTREQLRDDWRLGNKDKGIAGFQQQFQDLFRKVYQLDDCNLKDYFEEVQIQHNADYAFGESIAVQVEHDSQDRLSLARSYVTFTERLIHSVSPWQSTPWNGVQPNQELGLRSILFPNGNRAQLMRPPRSSDAKAIIRALQIKKASALIVLVGSGESPPEGETAGLFSLLSPVLPRIASDAQALILDDGTEGSVAALVGQGVADRGRDVVLLGVAPAARVRYPEMPTPEEGWGGQIPLDPNHSHFVVVEGETWEDALNTKYDLVKELAKELPVVTILAGEGPDTRKELLRIVQQGWPIIVLEGTSRLADDLVALSRATASARPGGGFMPSHSTSRQIPAPWIAEIIDKGHISVLPSDGSHMDLTRLVYRNLPPGKALELAWSDLEAYERSAIREQRRVRSLHCSVLALGVLGIIAALAPTGLARSGYSELASRFGIVFRILAVAAPVGAYFAFAMLPMVNPEKYAKLRRAVETIRSEIFQCRTWTGRYSRQQTVTTSQEVKLTERLKDIEKEVFPLGFEKPPVADEHRIPDTSRLDDGFSALSPERYIAMRLTDQQESYLQKERHGRQAVMASQFLIALFLAVGAGWSIFPALVVELPEFMGAGAREVWSALAITLALAVMAYIGVRQVEQRTRVYRMVATNLKGVLTWWTALSPDEKTDQKNIDSLVQETETILALGWEESLPFGRLQFLTDDVKRMRMGP